MNPLVTVAVAAYNVEKFLKTGMQYITNQTYKNLEIVLVDDGSTDKTPEICDQIAREDDRIVVVHKDNGGLGSARNVGIDLAKGKYLYFFDVDDSVDLNLIEENVRNAEEKDVDLIIFGYKARFDGETQEEVIALNEQVIHSNEQLKRAYCEELLWMKHGNGFAWNKFYRVSFLRQYNFHFGNQRIQQDEPFNMQLYPKLEKVYIDSKCYYHYVIYSKSNAGSRYLPNKFEIIKDVYSKFMDFYNDWELTDRKVLEYICRRFLSGAFMCVIGNYYHNDCRMSFVQRKRAIDDVLSDPDVIELLNRYPANNNENILNKLMNYAFYHRKTLLLMLSRNIKEKLRKIMR